MAKNRCPSCGASHKEPPGTCRLCGYVMDGSVETPLPNEMARAAAPPKKRGAGSLALIGVVIVVLLGVAALALHIVSGGSTVNKAVEKIGIHGTTNGWKTVTDPEGGFTVSLPPTAAATSVGFAPADNGQLTGWLATIGEAPVDTQIYVLYGKVHANPGESGEDTVSRLGDAKMAADGGFVESRTQTSYQGYPAIRYKINRITFEGGNGYENALLFLKGDELYLVETLSIYPGDPADAGFAAVLNSLTFTS